MLRSVFGCALVIAAASLSLAVEPQRASKAPNVAVPTHTTAELERRIAALAAMRGVLAQKRDFKATEQPLADWVAALKKELKVEMRLDAKSLEDEGVDPATPITIDVKGYPVRTALKLVLDPLGLTYDLDNDNDILHVCTKVRAEERVTTRVYEVSDLVLVDLDDPHAGADFDSLVDAITSTVSAQSWDEVGGRGSICPFEAVGIHTLIVSQTSQIHEEVDLLLAMIRKARRGDARKRPAGSAPAIPTESGPQPPSGPLAANPDRDALRAPQTRLACELYAQLAAQAKKDGNLIFSPYSVAQALSMVAAGARGETAAEFARVLHGDLPPLRLHPAMAAQSQELPLGQFQGQQLRLANRLWAQKGEAPFVDEFLFTTRTHYGAEVAVADLAADATRKAINAWTEEQTSGKVRELFEHGSFDEGTRLVLVNALYFQGMWRKPFEDFATQDRPFHAPGGAIQTPTMHLDDLEATYARLEGLEVMTKNYRGSLAMTVLLPKAGRDFAEFERSLTAANLQTWLDQPMRPHVEILLPKFKHETGLDLKDVLGALGIKRVFQRGQADLTGICPQGELFLNIWKHRATIEVDEKGTIAAAATGGGGGFGALEKPRTPVFKADRPFVFLIRDLRTGTILFLGRVMNPAA